MGALANAKTILAAAVANGGTITFAYPAGTDQDFFTDSGPNAGQVVVNQQTFPEGTGAGTVAIAYGASNITVTNNTGAAWPVQAEVFASFGRTDINGSYNLTWPRQVQNAAVRIPAEDAG